MLTCLIVIARVAITSKRLRVSLGLTERGNHHIAHKELPAGEFFGIMVIYMEEILSFIQVGGVAEASPVVWFAFAVAAVVVAFVLSWRVYLEFIQEKFVHKIEWALLSIRLPREVMRSPQAMELVLNAFHQGGGVGTWWKRLVQGSVMMWFSLEIVSIEGNIYFFVHTPKKFKDLIESQIYAQYPQAEVTEVEDYVKNVPLYEPDGDWDLFGAEFKLTDPDPYPIKTYIDYGLDKSVGQKEEEKIDPLTLQLEFLGSLLPGEQIWTQILVRKADKRFRDPGRIWWKPKTWFKKRDWVGEGKDLTKKLLKDYADDGEKLDANRMTQAQKFTLEAVERSIDKLGFDCGIRVMYLAKKDTFSPTRISGLMGMYRPFSSTYLNGFKPDGGSVPDFNYKYQDWKGKKKQARKKDLQRAFIERGFYYPPYEKKPFVLNTEELATLFHFPGKVLVAPGVKRVRSTTAEPPSNLPS